MVELQSCASLVNASALCDIEQEVGGDSAHIIAEISSELQRERQRNAELMERISILEAQIQARCPNARGKNFKKFKKQKVEPMNAKTKDGITEMASLIEHESQWTQTKDSNQENRVVNWMSMDDTQFLNFEKLKDGYSVADFDDSEDSDDEDDTHYDEEDIDIHDPRDIENNKSMKSAIVQKECFIGGVNEGKHVLHSEISSNGNCDPTILRLVSQEKNEDQNGRLANSSLQKKPPKIAFCPKEVTRIIELEALSLKNAQSHTIRKIIVFASLGIRHGGEDMYELDFSHFSILRKGEPYVSPMNPGEHVLYENPGVRRKVFYPNRQNPTLCPVQIFEEEKAMRPSHTSCPSCFFLCIKYGGRTRNLPQNEYVRQRMGRNKLKSFGPIICQMAMLVHIRSGSFFFKALGITLLFMAGFPDDLVRKETKYRNLGLLQKYYRRDEDTEGEELFFPHPITCHMATPNSQLLIGKTTTTKSRTKRHTNSTDKPHNTTRTLIPHSPPSSSAPPPQFGVMGYTSFQAHPMSEFQSTAPHHPEQNPRISKPVIGSSGPNISYRSQAPYPMFPPPNAFVPMMYWPPPNGLPPCVFPSSCGYRSFPFSPSYIPLHLQNNYNYATCDPSIKNNDGSEEAESDSDSSSSNT